MNVLYFAWVRDRVGMARERIDPPDSVNTVGKLAEWLVSRSSGHAAAFRERELIRAAVNQEHVPFEHPISADDEIAFFPPMTGG